MKIKSVVDGVSFERWKTPLTGHVYSWLEALYESDAEAHFFFTTGNSGLVSKQECIHVLTIPKASTYRLIEEQYAYSCIGKYFRGTPNQTPRRKKRRYQTTWKITGASFTEELTAGQKNSRKKGKALIEFLILTEDEWIGIVADSAVWSELKNMSVQTAVRTYLK